VATEELAPLKLEGSLVATDQQVPDKPPDREDCHYSAWREPDGSELARAVILKAGAPTVEPYGLQVIHPSMSVEPSIPSYVSLQVDEHGTTTGAYKTSLSCVNPKLPGASVLMSDHDDSGGVEIFFDAKQQDEYAVAASPSASFLLSALPHSQRFDAEATVHSPGGVDWEETLHREVQSKVTITRIKA
jgi:hypothetical protein